MDYVNGLLLIGLLLAVNGFFVAAEIALVRARGLRIASAPDEGRSAALLTMRIQGNLESYLAACRLGITMATLGLGWVVAPAVTAILEPLFVMSGVPESVLHASAFIVGFLFFAALHSVVGEQLPKALAIRNAGPVSTWVAYPLHYCYLLVWPLNWVLGRTTSFILGLLGAGEAGHARVFGDEDHRGREATSREPGENHERQSATLHRLFEFDQRRVGGIMIPLDSVHVLNVSGDPKANMNTIRVTGHSRFPLIDGDAAGKLVGVVSTMDICRAVLNGEPEPCQNLEQFRRPAMIVSESQRIAKLFDYLRIKRARLACVVDEFGNFTGIVTVEDLIEAIADNIGNDSDEVNSDYRAERVDNTSWHVDGRMSLADAERLIGLEVGNAVEARTVGELVLHRLSRMPVRGDVIAESGYQLLVLEHDGLRVDTVRVTRMDAIFSMIANEG